MWPKTARWRAQGRGARWTGGKLLAVLGPSRHCLHAAAQEPVPFLMRDGDRAELHTGWSTSKLKILLIFMMPWLELEGAVGWRPFNHEAVRAISTEPRARRRPGGREKGWIAYGILRMKLIVMTLCQLQLACYQIRPDRRTRGSHPDLFSICGFGGMCVLSYRIPDP